MPRIDDLEPRLRQRIINTDPLLKAQQNVIFETLEESCREAEEFMHKYGEVDTMLETIERSRAFIRGELTAEEFQEGNKQSLARQTDRRRR